MKKYLCQLLMPLAASLACADTLIDATINAYSDGAKASKAFNQSVSSLSGADNSIQEAENILKKIDDKCLSLKETSETGLQRAEKSAEKLKKFSELYKKYSADYKLAQKSLNEISSSMPLGEERISYAKTLIKQLRELIRTNPGDDFQDRNYALLIISQYENTEKLFDLIQLSIASIDMDLKMSQPRLEGTKIFLDMSCDFNSKTLSLNKDNLHRLEEIKNECQKLQNDLQDSYKNFLGNSKELNDARDEICKTYGKLLMFILSDMQKSEKYKNTIFRDVEYLDLQSSTFTPNKWKRFYAKSAAAMDSYALPASAPLSLKNPEIAVKNVENSISRIYQTADLTKKKNIRKEILALASDIETLRNELADSQTFFNYNLATIKSLCQNIENLNTSAAAILNADIEDYANAQRGNSDITMLASSANVAKMQFEVISSNMQKSFKDSADAKVKAIEYSRSMKKNIEEAKSALK